MIFSREQREHNQSSLFSPYLKQHTVNFAYLRTFRDSRCTLYHVVICHEDNSCGLIMRKNWRGDKECLLYAFGSKYRMQFSVVEKFNLLWIVRRFLENFLYRNGIFRKWSEKIPLTPENIDKIFGMLLIILLDCCSELEIFAQCMTCVIL